MKKIIAFLFFAMICVSVSADTISVDLSGWSQERKNMLHAMISRVLFESGITHSGILVSDSQITVNSPSASLSVLTKARIAQEYDEWKAENDAANQVAIIEAQAKQTELSNNTLKNATFAQSDAEIDSITNISQVRSYLKKLTRYIKAKE